MFSASRIIPVLALGFTSLLISGCNGPTFETAAEGLAPPIGTPVGPIPGPPGPTVSRDNPYGQQAVPLAEGRQLFASYNCAGCHGDHAGGGMGPSLRDEDWIYGGTSMQVYNSIAEGRAHGMPAWGTKVPDTQIWKLVGYIQSLRTEREPQPPQE